VEGARDERDIRYLSERRGVSSCAPLCTAAWCTGITIIAVHVICIGASGAMVGEWLSLRPIAAIRESAGGVMFVSVVWLLWRTSVRFAFGCVATRPDGAKKVWCRGPLVAPGDDGEAEGGRVLGAVPE